MDTVTEANMAIAMAVGFFFQLFYFIYLFFHSFAVELGLYITIVCLVIKQMKYLKLKSTNMVSYMIQLYYVPQTQYLL